MGLGSLTLSTKGSDQMEAVVGGNSFWGTDGSGSVAGQQEEARNRSSAASDEHSIGQSSGSNSKLCARGHWRPAEDIKLKELVGFYGPQNWNLIAEKLEGRSGDRQFVSSKEKKSIKKGSFKG